MATNRIKNVMLIHPTSANSNYMNKSFVFASLIAVAVSVQAQSLPDIQSMDMDYLAGMKVIHANSVTLPLVYQQKTNNGKQLDMKAYTGGFRERITDKDLRKSISKANSSDEFKRREGQLELKPWLDKLTAQAKQAEYLMLSTSVEMGDYNFDTKSFPATLRASHSLGTGHGRISVTCAGVLWPHPTGSSFEGTKSPCIQVVGYDSSNGTFAKLAVKDDSRAQELKKGSRFGDVRFFMLARLTGQGSYYVETPNSTAFVLKATPVGLYAIDVKANRLLYKESLSGTEAAPSSTDGKVAPVAPSKQVTPKGEGKAKLPTITLE